MSAAGRFVVGLTPVICTAGAGSPGPNEPLAPAGPVANHELPVAGPRGEAVGQVIGAWPPPVDTVSSLGASSRLDVIPSRQNPAGVQPSASGRQGRQGRIRLRITVLRELAGGRRGGH